MLVHFPGGGASMAVNGDPSTFYHLNGNCQYNYQKLNKKIDLGPRVIVRLQRILMVGCHRGSRSSV